ncbi:unnamed protein product [Zymoseptoria tritici ST99CH_3D1]|uniref:Uncharacterized protein n=1 Tax=Zymoseptoria tritici ST99CH_1E4 TaxID=1276532 RepID=A0A2H1GNW0_ZYMTR|nr:unnamed protein product [Zymoseptoria tritici ST99CH_1E4]SMR57631.1 unnamed protein product [Zymoseptoria tritici ST99CH_3D1]
MMPRSPKRNGFILEGESPILDRSPPGLSYSPRSSEESIDRPMTPQSYDMPELLPGFHFSTTDQDVDVLKFHNLAAQMLSGESSKERFVKSIEDDSSIRQRSLQYDLGLDYPQREHVGTRHSNHMEACPECGDMFLADYLPTHLASGLGGCDGMLQSSFAPEIDEAYVDESVGPSKSQYYWIYQGDYTWNKDDQPRCDSGCEFDGFDFGFNDVIHVDQTMAYVKTLLQRPVSELPQESCDLCGDVFRSGSGELAQHIGQHSMDFTQKRHKCEECQIFFANEKDLDRHLQSADLNQHCGFTFRHDISFCTGHHPPTHHSNDHSLMQKHLWAWERCQFRTHRVTVARALADQVNQTAWPHMSVQDCRQTYTSLLPHYNLAGKDSPHLDDADFPAVDAHFSRLINDIFSIIDEYGDDDFPASAYFRPDSSILPKGREARPTKSKCIVDMSALQAVFNMPNVFSKSKSGHKRHAMGGSLPLNFLRQAERESTAEQSRPISTAGSWLRNSKMTKMNA